MKIKTIIFSLTALLLSTNLYAGDYDGVWEFGGEYHIAYQNGNQLLVVNLWEDLDGWDAMLGPISGNQAEVSTLLGDNDHFKISIKLKSSTQGTITFKSCSGDDCDLRPLNVAMPIHKIF